MADGAPYRIALLRGINVGPHRRIAMPALREALAAAGFADVRSYVQSGNLVLRSAEGPDVVGAAVERVLADRFGLVDVPVVVRTAAELAAVVAGNPFGAVADRPKLLQVGFLAREPVREVAAALESAEIAPEAVRLAGRELYAWHPQGIQRSPLARLLTEARLGVTVTFRNWSTVTALHAMAD